ncbi:MAG: SRPBCC domain-containing protein [Ignavibacteria bacterium]|nr:SRPBCC domain-containing protein [Ignavibacteria bacterium]
MESKEIFSSRIVESLPAKVFKAFSDPLILQRWWGPKGFTNTFTEFSFSEGGIWKFTMHSPEGKLYENRNIFTEIRENEKIVIEHDCAPRFILIITLELLDAKTRINWSMQFESAELRDAIAKYAIPANEENFDRLEEELKKLT